MSSLRPSSIAGGSLAALVIATLALLFVVMPGRAAAPAATPTTYAAGAYIVDMGQSPRRRRTRSSPTASSTRSLRSGISRSTG